MKIDNNRLINFNYYLALIYALISIFEVLFWPSNRGLFIDNVLFPFALLHNLYVFVKYRHLRLFYIFLFSIFSWHFLSNFLNDIINFQSLSNALIYLKISALFSAFYYLLINKSITAKYLENSIVIVFLSLCTINILILVNPFGFGEIIQSLYVYRGDLLISFFKEPNAARLSGTMADPNTNSALFAIFFLYFISIKNHDKYLYSILCLIMILLSQSRTVFLMLLIIVVVIYVISKTNLLKKIIILSSSFLLLILYLILKKSDNLFSLINGSAFKSNSWLMRVDSYSYYYQMPDNTKIIGRGVTPSPFETIGFYFDSEYIAMLIQHGIIGIILWFTFVAYNIRQGFIGKLNIFRISSFIFILGISITNTSISNLNISLVLFMFLAISISIDNIDNKIQANT